MSKLALAFAFLALAAPAAAGPVEATKPSQIVTVSGRTGLTPPCFSGALEANFFGFASIGNADGTSAPFVIPPKSVFVVQSFESLVSGGTANQLAPIAIVAVDPANPPTPTSNGAFAAGGAIADATGTSLATTAIPGGLVVKPPATLCFQANPTHDTFVVVHGFFAKDK
jgi:hypothetical protein